MAVACSSTALFGCEHYRCGCKLVCSVCNEAHWCRFCHDEAQDHKFDRCNLEAVECAACRRRQCPPQDGRCAFCCQRFARYWCARCSVYDLNDSKEQFHCDGYGICRKGGRHNFYHCDACGYCIDIDFKDRHQHKPDALGVPCLLCGSPEILADSTEGATVMTGCGHAVHTACLHEAFGHLRILCPICYVSLNPLATEEELLYVQARELSLETSQQIRTIPKAVPWLSELVLESTAAIRHQYQLPEYMAGLADRVRPMPEEMRAGRAATHTVGLAAHQLEASGISIHRTWDGGSSGRKVNVRGDLDVDLVLFANEAVNRHTRDAAFGELVQVLRKRGHGVRRTNRNPAMLKLEVQVPGGFWVPLDISLTQNRAGPEVPRGGLVAAQREAVLERVLGRRPVEHRRDDDVGLSESMFELTAAAPGQVNDAVRLAKCWCKFLHREGMLPACQYPPLSVLIETMMLGVWHALQAQVVAGRLRHVNALACFVCFLDMLPLVASGHQHLYTTQFYTLEQARQMRVAWDAHNDQPVVLHPVNPSNNMATRIPVRGWAELVEHAKLLSNALKQGDQQEWDGSTLGQAVRQFAG